MITSIGRRSLTPAGAVAGAVVLVIAAFAGFAGFAAPAGAAAGNPSTNPSSNPCKVLRRSEIQRVFGGTVSPGRQGFKTPASTQCEFSVTAFGDRPAGTLIVHLTTSRAKSAYQGLERQAKRYAAVDGVPDALYSDTSHVVNLLQGDTLVGVKAAFTIIDPLPVHAYGDEVQLAQLAQLAANRV
jgi:hypothetical protein